MDSLTAAQRSEVMKRVRGAGTRPELAVRSLIHRMGFRYSLHSARLPGKPDIVLNSRHKVVLIHGCFWHGHACRSGRNVPSTNTSYWLPKLGRNKARDRRNLQLLKGLGWEVLVIWECQLKNPERVRERLARFLGADRE